MSEYYESLFEFGAPVKFVAILTVFHKVGLCIRRLCAEVSCIVFPGHKLNNNKTDYYKARK